MPRWFADSGTLAAALAVACLGCAMARSSSHPLPEGDFGQLREEVNRRQGQVIFVDPKQPHQLMRSRGRLLVERDQAIVTGPQGSYHIPLAQVREIDAGRPVRGAAIGLGCGVALGLVLAVVSGLAPHFDFRSDEYGPPPPRDRKRDALQTAAIAVPVWAFIGSVTGLVAGRHPRWRISPAPAPPPAASW